MEWQGGSRGKEYNYDRFALIYGRDHGGSDGKVSACNAGDLFPGSGRSPGEGNGNPLQYSCLENSTVLMNLKISREEKEMQT